MQELINNDDLTRKLNYILRELGINKKTFLEECKKYNPSISKPTILNMLNGKNTTTPTLQTLSTVIKVCKNSNNENLKRVSFNYLLNDGIYDIEAKNFQVFDELGLDDDTIETLKRLNTSFIPLNKIEIVNTYLYHMPLKYWDNLDRLKKIYTLKKYINENDLENIQKILTDVNIEGYLMQYFSNIYDLLQKTINKKELVNKEKLNELLQIVIDNLKIKLQEQNNNLFDNLEEI